MKLTLYYDFIDELYLDGKEIIEFTMRSYPYTVFLDKDDEKLTVYDLYDLYRLSAKQEAAYKYLYEFGEVISKSY